MASFYSQLYAEAATPQVVDVHKRVEAGIAHASMRYARAEVTLDAVLANSDTLRLKQFKSSDRINRLMFSCTAGGGSARVDIGIYKSGVNHDGSVLASGVDAIAGNYVVSGVKTMDCLLDVVGYNFYRGLTLWEWVNSIAPGTYAADPMEDWDIVITGDVVTGSAAWQCVMEFYYTTDLGD